MNWHFIISDQGYFAQAGAPSPLLHTWSLAVEEQYYLIWPLIALIVVRLRGVNALAKVAAIGAAASALLMGTMYWAGVSIDRLYYGTDTRAQALLIGSFLGAVGSHTGSRFNILPTRWTRAVGSTAAGASWESAARSFWSGLGMIFKARMVLCMSAASSVWAWPSRAIVACITFRDDLGSSMFLTCPCIYRAHLVWTHLYHWPLFLAIDHAHTGLLGVPLLVARLAATFCAASISFFAIEEPIRRRRVLKGRIAWPAMGAAVVVSVLALSFATVSPAVATVPVRGENAWIAKT